MPLPIGNQEWPPPHIKRELRLYEQWGAWYAGDPDHLARVYGGNQVHGVGLDPKGWDRPQLGVSGVINKMSRWFWGSQTPAGQVRNTKLHVPIAGDISSTSADLLFSEPPTLRVKGKNGQKRLDAIMHEAGIYGALLEDAEVGSSYGVVYLRLGWSKEIQDTPNLIHLLLFLYVTVLRFGSRA